MHTMKKQHTVRWCLYMAKHNLKAVRRLTRLANHKENDLLMHHDMEKLYHQTKRGLKNERARENRTKRINRRIHT